MPSCLTVAVGVTENSWAYKFDVILTVHLR